MSASKRALETAVRYRDSRASNAQPGKRFDVVPAGVVVGHMIDIRHKKSRDVILLRVREDTLDGFDLTDAFLPGAQMDGISCRGTILRGATLSGADLRDTDFHGADLTDAILTGADLRGADLTGADLTGADLTNVVSDHRTHWPAGFTP